jgi:hypothetical protein
VKFRVGAIVFVLCTIAAACSDTNDPVASADTTSTTPSTQPSTTSAPPTTTEPVDTWNVEVATINVLHGLVPPISGCAEYTDQCNIEARVEILWSQLEEDVGCPEIVALQEIAARWFEVIPEQLPFLCDGNHVLLTEDLGLPDQEMILTSLPVLADGRVELAGAPVWSAHWAQLDAGDGVTVDVFSTHFASNSFNPPCSGAQLSTTCLDACPAGSNLGDCHPYEALAFLDTNAAAGSLQLVIGDLNKRIDEPRIEVLLDAGFIDTHLAAGNAECPEEGGVGCTTGIGNDRESDYAGLDRADNIPQRRIDFVLARPPEGCTLLVEAADEDGDGTNTGVWANLPLAEPVDGLYFVSDHTGIQADVGLDCE